MLKTVAALALAALFGVSAAVRERRANPPPERLLATPERWDGDTLRLPPARVLAAERGFLLVEVDGLRLPVRGEHSAAPGEVVDVRGVFRARERRLDAVEVRHAERSLIPALLLAWAVLNFLRRFRVSKPVLG